MKKLFLFLLIASAAWPGFAQTTSSLQQNLSATSTSFSVAANVVTIVGSNTFGANAWVGISGCTVATQLNGQALKTNSSTTTSQVVGTLYNTQVTPLTLANVSSTADTSCKLYGQGWNPWPTAPFPAPGSVNCPQGNGSPGCAPGPGTNTWAYDPAMPCGASLNGTPCIPIVQISDTLTSPTGTNSGDSVVPSFTGETNSIGISLSDLGTPPEYFFSLTKSGGNHIFAGHIDPTHCGGMPCFVNDVPLLANSWTQTPINYGGFSRNPANRPGIQQALWYTANLSNPYALTLQGCKLQYSAGTVSLASSCKTLYNLNTCPGFAYLSIGTGLAGQGEFKVDNYDNTITLTLGSGTQAGFQDHMIFTISLLNGTCAVYDTYGYTGTALYSAQLSSGHGGTGWTTGETATLPCGATVSVIASGGVVTAVTPNGPYYGGSGSDGSNCVLGTNYPAAGAGSNLQVNITGIGHPGSFGVVYPAIASASCPAGPNLTLNCETPIVTGFAAYGIHNATMMQNGAQVIISGWGTTFGEPGGTPCSGCDYVDWTPSTGVLTSSTSIEQNGHPAYGYNWYGSASNPNYYVNQPPTAYADPLCSNTNDCYLLFTSSCSGSPGGEQWHSATATPLNDDSYPIVITASINTPGSPTQTNPPGFTCPYGQNSLFTLNRPTGIANWYVHHYENANNYASGCAPSCENFEGADTIGTLSPDGAFFLVAEDMNYGFAGNAGLGNTGTAAFVATFAILLQTQPGSQGVAPVPVPWNLL